MITSRRSRCTSRSVNRRWDSAWPMGEKCRGYLRDVMPALAGAPDKELDALASSVGRLPLVVRLLARLLMRPGMTPVRLLVRLKQEPLGRWISSPPALTVASQRPSPPPMRASTIPSAACLWRRCVRSRDHGDGVARVADLAGDMAGDVLADLCGALAGRACRGVALDDARRRAALRSAQPQICRLTRRTGVRGGARGSAPGSARLAGMEAAMAEVLAAVDRLVDAGEASAHGRLLVAPMRISANAAGMGSCSRATNSSQPPARGLRKNAGVLGNLGLCAGSWATSPGPWSTTSARCPPRKARHTHRSGRQLSNLGVCYREQRDIPKAIEHLQRSLAIEIKLGRLEGQAR